MRPIFVCNVIKRTESFSTRYDSTYMWQISCYNKCIYVSLQCEKNACFNYREFDLKGDPARIPHTWYLSGQSFIPLLKLF